MINVDLAKAEEFIWRTARLLDRRRYETLFLGGSKDGVLSALRPYQNEDGGFGSALEPDLRTPASQPIPVWTAFCIFDEIDAMDDPMVGKALKYLQGITTPQGGVPFVLASASSYPHGWWWEETNPSPPASLNPTAALAGFLYKHGVQHPWLDGAAAFSRGQIDGAAESLGGYDVRTCLTLLDHIPDRTWAEDALSKLAERLLSGNLVELDPAAAGESHNPLFFAPTPDAMARRLFSDAVIEGHLKALEGAQEDDGGWPIAWPIWTPMAGLEWRASVTIEALTTLRSYGRLG